MPSVGATYTNSSSGASVVSGVRIHMKRQGDPGQTGGDAVFRSSRRVSFVVRSNTAPRRVSGTNVSREPMDAMQVDVRPEPAPSPPAFGLDSDWRELSESLSAVASGQDTLRLWNRESGDAFAAHAAKRDGAFYIVASDAEADPGSELIEIEQELFDLVKSGRKAIVVGLEPGNRNRVVATESVRDLFGKPAKIQDAPRPPPQPAARPPEKDDKPAQALAAEPPRPEPPQPANAQTPPRPAIGQTDGGAPEGASRLRALTAPRGFPDSLQSALVSALRPLSETFHASLLFQVEYIDGQTEYLLGFTRAEAAHEAHLEAAVNAALAAANRPDVELGITFLEADDPMVVRISRVGQQLI